MPVNLYPAPFSRIQQSPIVISPPPASHALPPRPGSLAFGMGHPHPAMSMMSAGAPMGLGQSFSMQDPRIPGAVLTNGLANPYIQHNSLASAGPVYPYNASVYSEQPYEQDQVRIPNRSHEQYQHIGGYPSGIYAYAGGMPDSLPRNPPSRFAQVGIPSAGMNPDGYMEAHNPPRYPSTIYPDPPELQDAPRTWRDADACKGCREQRLREEAERYAEERLCDCHHHHTHAQRQPSRRHRKDHSPGIAIPFSDSSSDDQVEDTYLRPSRRRRRTAADEKHQLLSQRSRDRSRGSGRKRTASRAPGLPSVAQLSVSSGDYHGLGLPDLALEDIGERTDAGHIYRNVQQQNADPRRRGHPDRDEFDPESQRPEDLRLDTLRLHADEPRPGNVHPNTPRRGRHVSIPRNWVPAGQGVAPESPVSQRLSPPAAYRNSRTRGQSRDTNGRMDGTASRNIASSHHRNLRVPQSLPHHLGSPIQESMMEAFPLASKRNSPSRLHRHEYEGNQPAGFTTRSKLHPNL